MGVESTIVELVGEAPYGAPQLDVPNLLIPAVQVNIRAGKLPPPDADGVSYLRVPLNILGRPL